jgi:hypothetical protein
LNSFKRVAEYSNPGDVVFIHYSGHGGQLVDQDGGKRPTTMTFSCTDTSSSWSF